MTTLSLRTGTGQIVLLLVVFAGFCLFYSCQTGDEPDRAGEMGPYAMPEDHRFIGDQTCRSCHMEEVEKWEESHHFYAMTEASEETVRGDFDNAVLETPEETYRFYRDGERFMMDAPDADGEIRPFEVVYTFGWEPLQQYLIDTGSGKYQAVHASWDTEQEAWFSLRQQDVEPGDWLHWTGAGMNWNTMCADCHSTNLRQNYDPQEDAFHTTWSSIQVSCEACHGPGVEHVEFMESESAAEAEIERIREDLALHAGSGQLTEINSCAPCHALRQQLTGDYIHGDPFLDHYDLNLPVPDYYYPDGQIYEEVFEIGSFLQSKMFHDGIRCSDCHDPHTQQLRRSVEDNRLCMDCHEPRYNTPDHHFHDVGTEASQCINCHMPGRYYMEVDFRRDHSFRVPRPDLSREHAVPNACNDCHDDRSADWAAEAIEEWYGPDRPPHYSEAFLQAYDGGIDALDRLREILGSPEQTGLVRASAVWHAGRFDGPESEAILEDAMQSEEDLVRVAAARAIAERPESWRRPLLGNLLNDPVRAVRVAAASGVTAFDADDFARHLQEPFQDAMEEYRHYLDQNLYFPQGQMNLARYHDSRQEIEQAMQAYRRALELDHEFYPARVNLAHLYYETGRTDRAEQELRRVIESGEGVGEAAYAMALLLSEQERLEEALDYFERAADARPEQSRIFYNRAIALQRLQRPGQARSSYERAIELEPHNMDYIYGLITLHVQQGEYREALQRAETLRELYPANEQIRQLYSEIEQRLP